MNTMSLKKNCQFRIIQRYESFWKQKAKMRTSVEELPDFVVFKDGGQIVHSAVRNAKGTYDDNAGADVTQYGRTLKDASRNYTKDIFSVADPALRRNNNTGNTFFYFRIDNKVLKTNLGTVKNGVRTITKTDEIAQFLQQLKGN